MPQTLKITTTVLPGHRIVVSAPQLPEGQAVDVVVSIPEAGTGIGGSMVDLIGSLPPGPRSATTWEELERSLERERASWDR